MESEIETKKAGLPRSRSVNDIKLEYGCSTKKKAEAGAGARFRLVNVDHQGKLRSRSMSDMKVDHQGYSDSKRSRSRSRSQRVILGGGLPRLVYDRTNPKPAAPSEIADCTFLAELAVDFFNKDNPHMPYSKEALELVKVTGRFLVTGTTYYLTFLTKSHFQIVDASKIKNHVFPFFESEIWYSDRTAQVERVNIVDFCKLPYPFTRRVDLVYQNLGNWSTNYYNVPNHTLVAPVIGLLAYDSDTNSTTPVPVLLNITRDDDPIIVRFDQNISSLSVGLMKCVEFGPNGAFGLSDMTAKRSCLARGQGHFSVVVPYESKDEEKKMTKKKKWWIMGIVLGGVALVILVVFGILVYKFVKWQRIREMERESERSEGLNEVWIGNSKFPSASV